MSKTVHAAVLPEEVRAYACERGIEQYIEPLLAAVKRYFPETTPHLIIEEDPEIEEMRHIVICIRPNITDVNAFLAARTAYKREMFSILPYGLRCEIRLGLRDSQ